MINYKISVSMLYRDLNKPFLWGDIDLNRNCDFEGAGSCTVTCNGTSIACSNDTISYP